MVPARQLEHVVAPTLVVTMPEAHLRHLDVPEEEAYRPWGQGKHVLLCGVTVLPVFPVFLAAA